MNDEHRLEGPLRLRPTDEGVLVTGRRCPHGHYATAYQDFVCPDCGAVLEDADFGPRGRLWSYTTITTPAPGRVPPFTLAYVDLDHGPRILCDVPDVAAVHVDQRVRVIGIDGRPAVSIEEER